MNDSWHIFRYPIALWFLSIGGLFIALIADGFANILGWIGLSVPILIIVERVVSQNCKNNASLSNKNK